MKKKDKEAFLKSITGTKPILKRNNIKKSILKNENLNKENLKTKKIIIKNLVEPKIINTSEKPSVNKIIGIKFTFFFSINSFKELPEI